jgi:zinc transport system substrate-binding protein
MVEILAPDEIKLIILIPPDCCPGHFDLKPRDVVLLSRASLIVRHDFQDYLDRKLESLNFSVPVVSLDSPGNLIIPDFYLQALERMKDILETNFPGLSRGLEANLESARRVVGDAGKAAREKIVISGLVGLTALSAEKQADFLRWIGIRVPAVFDDSPEQLSLLNLKNVVEAGNREKVDLVVGNLQSGGERTARNIAREIGKPFCILSSFPKSSNSNSTYAALLLENINLLTRARKESVHP